ncbi:putative 3'-5' exonuclease PolB-like domain-containing protein [Sphingomonas antarctica]|uniref:hypothetical protein n=1 Tax=Sphingomonas antarctica TaxID=2040274 RepID=UPI0039E909F9
MFDIESIVEVEPDDGSFPKWPLHRPVVASFLTARLLEGRYDFRLDSIVCKPGRESAFYAAVDKAMPGGATTIGYNTRGYDLAVLQLGAIAERRFDLEGLSRHARAHRFGRDHCDLAEMYSLYGGTKRPGLAEICDRLQIPCKTSTHGSDVGDLWRRGDVDAIARYCEEDVAATYLAWLAWHAWRHSDETLMSRPLAAFAQWIEASAERKHLLPFAKCPSAAWARPRAVASDVAAALKRAEHRVLLAADERAFGGHDPF